MREEGEGVLKVGREIGGEEGGRDGQLDSQTLSIII